MARTNEEILLSNIASNTASPINSFWVDNNSNYGKPSTFITDFKKPSEFGASIPAVYDQMVIELGIDATSNKATSFYSASILDGYLPAQLATILANIDSTYSTSLATVLAEVVDIKVDSEHTYDSLGAIVKNIKKVRVVANIWISE
jgi:hypothetical protein